MTRLQELYTTQGQSPWLDNLKRSYLVTGRLQELVEGGVRGVTANPTVFQRAIAGSPDYDERFRALVGAGASAAAACWELMITEIESALRLLRPLYDESGGGDGFVSIELDPELAHDTVASVGAARDLHRRMDEPNLLVAIPATPEGIPAVQQMIGEGRSVNVTLIFSLERYAEVIDAYLDGLEAHAASGGDLSRVHSVASFFVSRVDTEVDHRLEVIGTPEALRLRGRAAVAQAKLAYMLFRDRFQGPRWGPLAAHGARLQRPLWASTSIKNLAYPDTLYVDSIIGPDSVNSMPEATIETFEDHGRLARTIEVSVNDARGTLEGLAEVGVDLADVSRVLEDEGVAAFTSVFHELLGALERKRAELGLPMSGWGSDGAGHAGSE
jgi:transaldolase